MVFVVFPVSETYGTRVGSVVGVGSIVGSVTGAVVGTVVDVGVVGSIFNVGSKIGSVVGTCVGVVVGFVTVEVVVVMSDLEEGFVVTLGDIFDNSNPGVSGPGNIGSNLDADTREVNGKTALPLKKFVSPGPRTVAVTITC